MLLSLLQLLTLRLVVRIFRRLTGFLHHYHPPNLPAFTVHHPVQNLRPEKLRLSRGPAGVAQWERALPIDQRRGRLRRAVRTCYPAQVRACGHACARAQTSVICTGVWPRARVRTRTI